MSSTSISIRGGPRSSSFACHPIAEDEVISLLTLAFSDDPPTRWMFPEPNQYLRHFPTFIRLYAGAGFDSGSVLAVEGNEGFAIWLPPGVHSDEAGIADLLRQSVAATRLTEILDLVAQMTSFQPAEPHWFLPLIGVDPMSRGRGRGSAIEKLGVIKAGSCQPVFPMLRKPR